jgi:hypothetical protein
LGIDAQAVAGAAQRAREYIGGFELLTDLGGGDRLNSSVVMSSVMPSRKYSSSLAPLRFSK